MIWDTSIKYCILCNKCSMPESICHHPVHGVVIVSELRVLWGDICDMLDGSALCCRVLNVWRVRTPRGRDFHVGRPWRQHSGGRSPSPGSVLSLSSAARGRQQCRSRLRHQGTSSRRTWSRFPSSTETSQVNDVMPHTHSAFSQFTQETKSGPLQYRHYQKHKQCCFSQTAYLLKNSVVFYTENMNSNADIWLSLCVYCRIVLIGLCALLSYKRTLTVKLNGSVRCTWYTPQRLSTDLLNKHNLAITCFFFKHNPHLLEIMCLFWNIIIFKYICIKRE